jgi:hypothetical protein
MKLCSKILAIAILAFTTYAMVGCAAPAGYSYQNVSIALSNYCDDCGTGDPVSGATTNGYETTFILNNSAGGCLLFNATVYNAPPNVSWALHPTANLVQEGIAADVTPTLGTLSNSTGLSNYYCQNGAPVYGGLALTQASALGIPNGDILMTLSVPVDPTNPSAVFTRGEMIQIYSTAPVANVVPGSNGNVPAVNIPHGTGSYVFGGFITKAEPCGPTGGGLPVCSQTTTVDLGTYTPTLYTANSNVDWALSININNVLSDTTTLCTFTSFPTTAQLATANAATPLLNECTLEGFIVLGGTYNGVITLGTTTATYYAPSAVPTNQPVVVVQADASPQVQALAYVGIY